ncbi:hypothetical protein [Actinoplanes sp. NPDC051494]|uniref:hypothetical protein n=1 Tax=Actinoplanes sp. NPDC051494 TaxID=3363907 RepID=UPI0037AC0487
MVTDLARGFLRRVLSTFLALALSAVAAPHLAAGPPTGNAPAAQAAAATTAQATTSTAAPLVEADAAAPPGVCLAPPAEVRGEAVVVRPGVLTAQFSTGVPGSRAPPSVHV